MKSKTVIPGLYTITCLATGKNYIGGSGDVQSRVASHKSRLRSGIHPIAELQADFTLYGEEQFKFDILQLFLTREEVLEKESEMLNEVRDWARVYNKLPGETSPPIALSNGVASWITDIRKIVQKAIEVAGSESSLCRKTGLSKSVIWRILNGKTKSLNTNSLGAVLEILVKP